jgi:hypothetical protein
MGWRLRVLGYARIGVTLGGNAGGRANPTYVLAHLFSPS